MAALSATATTVRLTVQNAPRRPPHRGWRALEARAISRHMSETDAQRCRKEAEECRREAEKTVSQLDKEAWLRLAADWIKLAQVAEKRRGF